MTNLEGRVIRRRRRWTRRPASPTTCSCSPPWPTGSAPGTSSAATPRRLRGAAPGQRRGGRLRRHQLPPDRRRAGRLLALPGRDHPGTRRLFTERFATPDGRARFLRVEHVDAHEPTDADYPYVLTTGRVLAQYQSGTQTRRTRSLQLIAPTPRAELHPDLARALGIGPDDVVELATRRGRRPLPRARHRHDPARRRLRALPLGRRLQRQRAHRPGAGPDQPDARLQGLRRRHPRRRPRRTHPPTGNPAAVPLERAVHDPRARPRPGRGAPA